MDSELDVLAKLLVELLEIVFVFGNLIEELDAFFDKVLPDDLQNLRLLQHLT